MIHEKGGGQVRMVNSTAILGLFQDVETAADAIEKLRQAGISDRDITVMSGSPQSAKALGRPQTKTYWLGVIVVLSAILGFLVGLFFDWATPYLFIIRVGGMPYAPIPPNIALQFEFTMLFMLAGAFLGFIWLTLLPSFGPQFYDPRITAGRIGVLVVGLQEQKDQARTVMAAEGAESVEEVARRRL
jgi:hypothetical protein